MGRTFTCFFSHVSAPLLLRLATSSPDAPAPLLPPPDALGLPRLVCDELEAFVAEPPDAA